MTQEEILHPCILKNGSGVLQLRGLGVSLCLSTGRSVISALEGKAAKDSGETACNPTDTPNHASFGDQKGTHSQKHYDLMKSLSPAPSLFIIHSQTCSRGPGKLRSGSHHLPLNCKGSCFSSFPSPHTKWNRRAE